MSYLPERYCHKPEVVNDYDDYISVLRQARREVADLVEAVRYNESYAESLNKLRIEVEQLERRLRS